MLSDTPSPGCDPFIASGHSFGTSHSLIPLFFSCHSCPLRPCNSGGSASEGLSSFYLVNPPGRQSGNPTGNPSGKSNLRVWLPGCPIFLFLLIRVSFKPVLISWPSSLNLSEVKNSQDSLSSKLILHHAAAVVSCKAPVFFPIF